MIPIVTIGGGSGQSNLLHGLKDELGFKITAVVSSADSGGSSGVLRDAHSVLPPGDFRRCLQALATTQNRAFQKAFLNDDRVGGDPLLNVMLVHLMKRYGEPHAFTIMEEMLETRGHVYPVTLSRVDLCAEFENGVGVRGEHLIDTGEHDGSGRILRVWLEPRECETGKRRHMNPFAHVLTAIAEAEYIVICPGDLYTSILPNVLVHGIPEALQKTSADLVFITNVMTKRSETSGFRAEDFVREFEKYAGRRVDTVVCNSWQPTDAILLDGYAREGAVPVWFFTELIGGRWDSRRVVRDQIGMVSGTKKRDGSTKRIIRHDPAKLTNLLFRIARNMI